MNIGSVTILEETTKDPITLMGKRAGICWGADTSDNDKNYIRGLNCLKSGHNRVMEYVNVEMVLDGYSARVIREWYTHIGSLPTRLQESTRRVNYHDFKYVTPPSIYNNAGANECYRKIMEEIANACAKLETEFEIPREDAGMVLPLGMCTRIVDKRNLRNLVGMSHQRMCGKAYHEYRGLFQDVYDALYVYSSEWSYLVSNYFVPKCVYLGKCSEQVTCGKFINGTI